MEFKKHKLLAGINVKRSESVQNANHGNQWGRHAHLGPDKLVMSNLSKPFESRLTLPFLLLWHSNNRPTQKKNAEDRPTCAGIVASSGNCVAQPRAIGSRQYWGTTQGVWKGDGNSMYSPGNMSCSWPESNWLQVPLGMKDSP